MRMLFNKENICSRISWIIFILIAIQVAQTLSIFTDVPPPPTRPAQFRSREDLKRYLQLVHEYYAIIGRPRFGRTLLEKELDPSERHLFKFFDINNDKCITSDEFHHRLEDH